MEVTEVTYVGEKSKREKVSARSYGPMGGREEPPASGGLLRSGRSDRFLAPVAAREFFF